MTQAEEFARRFNNLEYVRGNVLNVFKYFHDLDKNSEYEGDLSKPSYADYTDYIKPYLPVVMIGQHGEQQLVFTDIGDATTFVPDKKYTPDDDRIVSRGTPAFGMFIDGHIEGTYIFKDGSKMRIFHADETSIRVAEVITETEQDG